ncbi:MAG: polyprenyl synthetase family protein [Oscillospiraceae bacterium]|nr:polyprenyl synthetase family protein [Oscillospiraceae bacterium]
MNDYKSRLDGYAGMIESALPAFLPDAKDSAVAQAMHYSLIGGGKRIRGALLLAVFELFAGEERAEEALPFAAALEMVHAYSLIHDDLPCMDDDDMRRGKPSCHIAFGEAAAVLAGDALLTLAFEICTDEKNLAVFGAGAVLKAANALAAAAGTSGMIGGQWMDIDGEGKEVSGDYLRKMDEMKTGALICYGARAGCILAGAPYEKEAALARYALDLGLAFQIRDDILDKTAAAEKLGKPIGSDDKNRKSTYTGLYGLDGAKREAERLSGTAKAALDSTGLEAGFLKWLADYLLERGN